MIILSFIIGRRFSHSAIIVCVGVVVRSIVIIIVKVGPATPVRSRRSRLISAKRRASDMVGIFLVSEVKVIRCFFTESFANAFLSL